jgi:hypothetical protein
MQGCPFPPAGYVQGACRMKHESMSPINQEKEFYLFIYTHRILGMYRTSRDLARDPAPCHIPYAE